MYNTGWEWDEDDYVAGQQSVTLYCMNDRHDTYS